ncbi:permease [Candidatus Woesearchaeota archaeon]|nr:permease [Candidatus Woesearchaeota archaeon]
MTRRPRRRAMTPGPRVAAIAKSTLKDLLWFCPLFFVSIVISVVVEIYAPGSAITSTFGKQLIPAIFFATLAGIILPFPKYLSYPVAAVLREKGAYIGAVFGFISGEVMIGNLAEDAMEIRYFGWRFYTARFFLTLILITLGGLLLQFIMHAFGVLV